MDKALYVLSGGLALAGLYRRIEDGPNGETIAALTWLAACVLLSGGAIVQAIRAMRKPD